MSIILELQQAALDRNTPLADLLRRCLAVASKLGLKESLEWVQSELKGYKPEVLETPLPDYRIVPTEIMGFNPYHGWKAVIFKNPEEAEKCASKRIYNPVSELEPMTSGSSSVIHISLHATISQQLRAGTGVQTEFRSQISTASVIGILDCVRNLVHEWALKLERDGILGEGHTFTQAERAASTNVPVPGIIGNNNVIAIQTGHNESSPQTVTSGTMASEAKPKSGLLGELMSRIVKAIPERWIAIVIGSVATAGAAAYAWLRGHWPFH